MSNQVKGHVICVDLLGESADPGGDVSLGLLDLTRKWSGFPDWVGAFWNHSLHKDRR